MSRAGFKGERPGQSPRGLHKTEMEAIVFMETVFSKIAKSYFAFLVIIRNESKNNKRIVIT
jgi:hypothetical protein